MTVRFSPTKLNPFIRRFILDYLSKIAYCLISSVRHTSSYFTTEESVKIVRTPHYLTPSFRTKPAMKPNCTSSCDKVVVCWQTLIAPNSYGDCYLRPRQAVWGGGGEGGGQKCLNGAPVFFIYVRLWGHVIMSLSPIIQQLPDRTKAPSFLS